MYSILYAYNHACKNDNLNMILTWGAALWGVWLLSNYFAPPNPLPIYNPIQFIPLTFALGPPIEMLKHGY